MARSAQGSCARSGTGRRHVQSRHFSPIDIHASNRSGCSISQRAGDRIEAYKRDEALNVALVGFYHAEGAANLMATIYRQRANAYTRLGWTFADLYHTIAAPKPLTTAMAS
jgi:hypothetical protein